MIWDDHQNRCIGELSFKQKVIAVKLRRDRVVVALLTRVYVYRFSDLALLDQFNTLINPRGLLALSPDSSSTVLACPSITRGHVRVELYDARKSTLIPAHETELGCLALNLSGTRLATASEKGTLLRIFDTHTGQMLKELRRGTERAVIQSISFNADSTFVAASSDKGTVHIFSLSDKVMVASGADGGVESKMDGLALGEGDDALTAHSAHAGASDRTPNVSNAGEPTTTPSALNALQRQSSSNNKKSGLGFVNKFLPNGVGKYFESEWSFSQVRGIEAPSICAFGQEPYTIFVVGKDGSFLRANFKNGGEAQRISYNRFLKGPDDVLRVDGGGDSASGGTAEESNLHEVTGEKGFADLPVEKGE
jgi:WD40 repeat protein